MRIAVIDLGTNTFHLLIGEYINGQLSIIKKEKIAVKIGQGGISNDLITEDAKIRAIDTMKSFRSIIESHNVDHEFATATSAIRNAKNGAEVVDLIEKESGIIVEVIDGMAEAEYIYQGVKNALDIGDSPSLIMDIGGGSIEFIIADQKQTFWKQSFEIGGQRLIDKFHQNDPITPEEIKHLTLFIDEKLGPLFKVASNFEINSLIGSSGTFDTLSDIYCVKNGLPQNQDATELPLDFDEFQYIVNDLISRNRIERLDIPGMIPLRVDMIVVAVILVKQILTKLDIQNIRVSSYALKEGVLLKVIESIQQEEKIYKN